MQGVYTRVYNQSGIEEYYGWIPPHGQRLANGEYVDVPGLLENQFKNQASKDSYQEALSCGRVTVEIFGLGGTSSSSTC